MRLGGKRRMKSYSRKANKYKQTADLFHVKGAFLCTIKVRFSAHHMSRLGWGRLTELSEPACQVYRPM